MSSLSTDVLLLLGGLAAFVGDLTYLRLTWQRRVQPQAVSWVMWGVVPLLAAVPLLVDGQFALAAIPLGVSAGPWLVVATAGLRRVGNWAPDRRDLMCGLVAAAGGVAYACTQESVMGVSSAVLADLLATLPTLRAALRSPEHEGVGAYAGCAVAGALGLTGLTTWTLATAMFPVYLLAVSLTLCALVLRRPVGASSRSGRQLPPAVGSPDLAAVATAAAVG